MHRYHGKSAKKHMREIPKDLFLQDAKSTLAFLQHEHNTGHKNANLQTNSKY